VKQSDLGEYEENAKELLKYVHELSITCKKRSHDFFEINLQSMIL
jgi:hypothetical protein